ncbi:AAA family ATPase, partial [Mycobacterium sp. NS-7484]|uniref:AAA family ATPase n=1 Tax=Mycobacterium sp. NS-7484 TaxID=1834161 RepID=UPI001E4A73EB
MAGLTDGTTRAYDETTEKALLGATLLAPDACRTAFLSVRTDDWFIPVYRRTAALIGEMLTAGQPVDPSSVLVLAQSRGLVPAKIPPPAVFDAVQAAWSPDSADMLAQRIRDLSAARKLSETGTRLAQRMESAWTTGVDRADIAAAVAETRRACDEAERIATDLAQDPPTPMGEFLAVADEHHWLIPGLLERMERIVLTGAEGGGKTVLCTQLATCMAAGMHPFTGEPLGGGNHG